MDVGIILPDIRRERAMHLPASLPLSLHSAEQVRALDAQLIAAGTPGFELMQRAAHAAWRALRRRWPDAARMLGGRANSSRPARRSEGAYARRDGRQRHWC